MKHLATIAAMLLFALCGTAAAQGLYQPGFRTIGEWLENPPMRMEINIWYPCRRSSQELHYNPWTISAAANARPAQGQFPLLVLSHATPATRFSYHTLAASLARHGYIVVAPTHLRDSMRNMDDMFTWEQIAHRMDEITAAIEIVKREKDLKDTLNVEQLGFIGFGTGGTTGLIMGGAAPNCQAWPGYCKKADHADPYCSRKARDRINGMCGKLASTPPQVHVPFKAIACIAPTYGMLFTNASFSHFNTPLLLVSAGKDTFGRPETHSEPLARILGKKALYLDLPQADVGALMSPCPPALREELPELCESVTKETRARLHAALENCLLGFFNDIIRVSSPQSMIQLK